MRKIWYGVRESYIGGKKLPRQYISKAGNSPSYKTFRSLKTLGEELLWDWGDGWNLVAVETFLERYGNRVTCQRPLNSGELEEMLKTMSRRAS